MNPNYIRDEEPPMAERPWIVRWFWLLYLSGIALLVVGGLMFVVSNAHAQTVLPDCTFTATGNQGAAPLTPTLTWSCTNATACTASGADNRANWTGAIPTSGSRTLTNVTGDLKLGLACQNGTSASKLVEWTHDLKDTKGGDVTPTSWIIDHGATSALGESKSVATADAIQNPATKVYSNVLTGLPAGARHVAIRAVLQPTGTPTPPAIISERSNVTVHTLVVPSVFKAVDVDVIEAPTPPVNVTVTDVIAYRDEGNGIGTRVALTPLRSSCDAGECTVVARVEQ